MFEVMTGNHQQEDERCDNHPVAWILIESTSSGILRNASRVSSFEMGSLQEQGVPVISIIGITMSRQDIYPLGDG